MSLHGPTNELARPKKMSLHGQLAQPLQVIITFFGAD
jgi:hypothetical protein